MLLLLLPASLTCPLALGVPRGRCLILDWLLGLLWCVSITLFSCCWHGGPARGIEVVCRQPVQGKVASAAGVLASAEEQVPATKMQNKDRDKEAKAL